MCWFLSALWEGVWAARPAKIPTELAEGPCEVSNQSAQHSKPTSASSSTVVDYRKGTYKMPIELLNRLRSFSTISHQYQYRLVIESLNEFLAAHGYPSDSE
jgi:hypothetical protein